MKKKPFSPKCKCNMSLSEDQIAKARMTGMLQKEDISEKVKKILKKRSSVALSALQQ